MGLALEPEPEPKAVVTEGAVTEGAGTGVAGLILTGGRSVRMGRDKASLIIGGVPLAKRLGALLTAATQPALEVGPGWSGLATTEPDPGEGPLVALAAGWRWLEGLGHDGPVIVIATDLPRLTIGVLTWLAGRAETVSVVPLVDGRRQPLCARWCPADLDRAVELAAAGERSVGAALGSDTAFLGEAAWGAIAPAEAFRDVDRPEDLTGLEHSDAIGNLAGREDSGSTGDLAQSP
jgi:molybdopterin-guanine dinucleotide biosynthesis protein A